MRNMNYNKLYFVLFTIGLVIVVSFVNYNFFRVVDVQKVYVTEKGERVIQKEKEIVYVYKNNTKDNSNKLMYEVTNVDEAEALWKLRVGQKYYSCPKVVEYGKGDGAKYICEKEKDFILSPGCIVYSYGINWDFTFDDAVSQRKGCNVYSFDPSMNAQDHNRSPLVHFYKTGVWGANIVNNQNWRLRTIGTLFKELGHSEATIDILKLDVEGAEFPALVEAMQSGSLKRVKQLAIEYHIWAADRSSLIEKLKILVQLHDLGFRAFYTDVNTYCARPSCLYVNNINYVNIYLTK